MKKLIILGLSLLTIVFLSTAALAAEISCTGQVNVEWEFTNNDGDTEHGFLGDCNDTYLSVDYTTELGGNMSGGLIFNVNPVDNEVAFDGEGWIKFDYNLFDLYAKTPFSANAGNELGEEYDITEAAGVQFDLSVMTVSIFCRIFLPKDMIINFS